MKTITERDGKNVNMQVVGDLHQYPDGSVHTVKNGKDVWEEGSGGGSGGGTKIIEATDLNLEGSKPAFKLPTGLTYTDFLGATIHVKDDQTNVEVGIVFDHYSSILETIIVTISNSDSGQSITRIGFVINAIYATNITTMYLYDPNTGLATPN